MIETTIADGCVKVECDGKTIARCESETDAERIKRALERESMTVVAFEVTPDEDAAIEDVLDLGDDVFPSTEGARNKTLVAVLCDWQHRLVAERNAKLAAHLEKVDENGPPGLEDPRTQMHLRLDDDDLRDIGAAVERRKAWDCEPDSDSCELGGMLAEICRGWLERVEHDATTSAQIRADAAEALAKHDERRRGTIDNGDGTITFPSVPVTVSKSIVADGSTVIGVRNPTAGERYWSRAIGVATCQVAMLDMPCLILSAPPAPQFREGGVYHDGYGKLCGPLEPTDNARYPWRDQSDDLYMADGTCFVDPPNSKANLLPGEVTVWRHPGLKAGEYWWDGRLFKCGGMIVLNQLTSHHITDWIDPPRVGKWKVSDGQEYATWEGE